MSTVTILETSTRKSRVRIDASNALSIPKDISQSCQRRIEALANARMVRMVCEARMHCRACECGGIVCIGYYNEKSEAGQVWSRHRQLLSVNS